MHGVGYGLIGANFVSFLEFFDMGLGLAMLCGSIFVVSLLTSLAAKVYHEGAKGIWPGIVEGVIHSVLFSIVSLMAVGCLEEFYEIALWILPSILLVVGLVFTMPWEKHEGFRQEKGRLVWVFLAIIAYIIIRLLSASFWTAFIVGPAPLLELLTIISQRLFSLSTYSIVITCIELGVVIAVSFSSLDEKTVDEDFFE